MKWQSQERNLFVLPYTNTCQLYCAFPDVPKELEFQIKTVK